jgi:hypothetical protein
VSTPAPHVVPIFATPFGVVTLPEGEALNQGLAALFAERATPARRAPGVPTPAQTFRSREDLLDWPDEPVQRMTRAMLSGVSAVAASLNEFTAEEFATFRVEARAWFTIVRPDGCVPSTNYTNTAWCAVYCVAAPAPSPTRFDSGVLRMHEARLGTMFPDATTSVTRIPYRPGHYTWRPVPGQLAVFPGAITHEIALVRAPDPLVLVSARVRFVGPRQTGVPWW